MITTPLKLMVALTATSLEPLQRPKHLIPIDRALMMAIGGHQRRTALQMPVRHGKTVAVTYGLFYKLLVNPNHECVYITNTEDNAKRVGRVVRDLYGQFAPQLCGHYCNPKGDILNWQVLDQAGRATGGGLKCLSVNSSTWGIGADFMVVDDTIGDWLQALSPTIRKRIWDWLSGDALTRLKSPNAPVFVIGTPYHSDDIFANILKATEEGGDRYEWLKFPAIAEANDPLGRQEGEALWPQKWNLDYLEGVKRDKIAGGHHNQWSCLYQLSPLYQDGSAEWPAEWLGNHIFFPEFPPPESHGGVILIAVACDPSKGKTAKSDFSSIATAYVTADYHVWIEIDMARRPTTAIEDALVNTYLLHKPAAMMVEANNEQAMIAARVLIRLQEAKVFNPQVLAIQTADGGGQFKPRIRIDLTPMLKSGRLHIKLNHSGRLCQGQLKDYPFGANDDGPDSISLVLRLINQLLGQKVQPPPAPQLRVG